MTAPHSKYRRTRDTSADRRQQRLHSGRVEAATRAAAAERAKLEARIEREAAELDVALGNKTAAERDAARARARDAARAAARRRLTWDLGFARNLVRQGYTLEHAVEFTGWPASMLDDVVPGQW